MLWLRTEYLISKLYFSTDGAARLIQVKGSFFFWLTFRDLVRLYAHAIIVIPLDLWIMQMTRAFIRWLGRLGSRLSRSRNYGGHFLRYRTNPRRRFRMPKRQSALSFGFLTRVLLLLKVEFPVDSANSLFWFCLNGPLRGKCLWMEWNTHGS